MDNIGVLGAGIMGNGIAQVAAANGFHTTLVDIKQEFLDSAVDRIRASLEKLHQKAQKENRPTEPLEKALSRLRTSTNTDDFRDCDLVIEAVTENCDLKLRIFRELDEKLRPDAIIASNTSAISLTLLGSATKRGPLTIGMHFMNPVPLMKLVEIIRGQATNDETTQKIERLALKMGKTPVAVQDFPGFVSNRVLMPMINEAIFCLHEGVANAEAIDTVMQLGMNHPMGPLKLADLIGLDTCLAIMNVLYDGFKDPKYRPCPLLVKKVNAGELGKKRGKGFYNY